jgi:hypothetical protein
MHGGSKIAMNSGSGDGQQRHNGRQDSDAIAIGNGMAVVQWTAQWAADNHCQCRSGAIRGEARWMAATIRMDGGSEIRWIVAAAMVNDGAMGARMVKQSR